MQSTRRSFLSQSLLALFASVPGFRLCAAEKQKFPGWNPGELDLHFIYTGCGENCFFRLPDGTAVLNDVGEFYRPRDLRHIPLLPHAKLLGGEWTSRYIQKMYPEKTLDYAVFSHWHSDHIGHSSYDKPRRPEADFRFRTLPDGRFGELHRAQPQAARRRTNETGGDVASAAGAVHVVEGVGDGFPGGKRTRVACCSMCPPEEILPHCIHSSAPFGVAGRLTRAL